MKRLRHRGDIMSPEKRSALMSRIRGKGTAIERDLERALRARQIRFRRHVRDLPGRPDIVIADAHLAVFVDGDFWHGWRFSRWEPKLSPKWKLKIRENICRDQRNFRILRRTGWTVLRIWEHQIERDIDHCVDRIALLLAARRRPTVKRTTRKGAG